MQLRFSAALAAVALLVAGCKDSNAPVAPVRRLTPTASSRNYYINSWPLGVVTNGIPRGNEASSAQWISNAGIRFARVSAYWNVISDPTYGPPMLDSLDSLITALANQGIEPYVTIDGIPCWAQQDCSDYAFTPAHDTAFQQFMTTMMNRYPQVWYWGLFNEPNAHGYYKSTGETGPSSYNRMFKVFGPVVHAAGRRTVALDLGDGTDAGGLPQNWVSALMGDPTVRPLVDAVGVHIYGAACCQAAIHDYMASVSQIMSSYGSTAELWLTEAAWPANTSNDDYYQTVGVRSALVETLKGTVPNWTRTYIFSAGAWDASIPDYSALVRNIGTPSAYARPAYNCILWIAQVWPQSPYENPGYGLPFLPAGCTW